MKEKIEHPILQRIAGVNEKYIENIPRDISTDPDEFLFWWWENHGKACEECPLFQTRNHVVKPDGQASARIMIVGEGPGFLEDLTAAPMVGPLELLSSHCNTCTRVKNCFEHRMLSKPNGWGKAARTIKCDPIYTGRQQILHKFYIRSAGAVLDGILISKWKFSYPRYNWIKRYNLLHQDTPWIHSSPWYITNVVLCRSTDITGLKDQSPESVPRQKCKRWFTFQWAAVQPELIVCFGRVALSVLLGSEKAANTVQPNTFIDTKYGKVLYQSHPAYFMREKSTTAKAYGMAKIASTLERALTYIGLPTE